MDSQATQERKQEIENRKQNVLTTVYCTVLERLLLSHDAIATETKCFTDNMD